MKYALLIIASLFALGCETVTNDDGTTTTRFDAKATAALLETGFGAYDRYNRQAHIVGYDSLGNPIYRQY